MDAGNRRTLWQIIDESLWGKPAGAVALLFAESVLLALAVVPPALWARSGIVAVGDLQMGPWYAYFVGTVVFGLGAPAVLGAFRVMDDPGRALLGRVCAYPAPQREYPSAVQAVGDIVLATGARSIRLYVYPSPLLNGFSYSTWEGAIVLALSTALAEALGRAELSAVAAHLVARAEAPASRWLMTGVASAKGLIEWSQRVEGGDAPHLKYIPALCVLTATLALMVLGPPDAGFSKFLLLLVVVLPALALMAGVVEVLGLIARLVRPGLDEWSDALSLHHMKDPSAAMRAMETVLAADNTAAAGHYSFCFYAPPGLCASTDSTERARLTAMRTLLGAEAIGVDAAPITGEPSLDALLMQDDVFK